MTHPLRLSLLLMSAVAFGVGCNRREAAVRTYAAPKDSPAPQMASADDPGDASAPDQSSINPATPIAWTAPPGWKVVPNADAMRYATFQVSADDPKADLTVVRLGAEAGELLPNLNRWAGQLKLPQLSEADVSKYTSRTQVSGEQAVLVDMTGSSQSGQPPTRLLAAIIPHGPAVWFLTLKAPEPIAAAQKANFEQFVHSVQFPAGAEAGETPQDSHAGSATHEGGTPYTLVKWAAPAGWQEQPGSNSMRVTSFRVGPEGEQAEVIISRIPQDQTGTMEENVNRWRGQVGLEPAQAADPTTGSRDVRVGGRPGMLMTFTGPQPGTPANRQALVAMTIVGPDAWFVKLLGPESVVAAQQANFTQFLNSLEFAPQSK